MEKTYLQPFIKQEEGRIIRSSLSFLLIKRQEKRVFEVRRMKFRRGEGWRKKESLKRGMKKTREKGI